mgnify:CR=1 FL=1
MNSQINFDNAKTCFDHVKKEEGFWVDQKKMTKKFDIQ